MRKLQITLAIALYAATLWAAAKDTSKAGRELYEKRCAGCHSLDTRKVGPPIRGVFGRAAAADPGFPYSEALKKARLVWDEPTLDRWLADPEALVPDNDMAFRLSDADERAAIIAYLKQLAPGQGRRQ
jgi:cytochrome c